LVAFVDFLEGKTEEEGQREEQDQPLGELNGRHGRV